MKFKELFSVSQNNKNKQSIWNPKKRKLKELGISEEDLLEEEVSIFN
jgi:hypothetical protein